MKCLSVIRVLVITLAFSVFFSVQVTGQSSGELPPPFISGMDAEIEEGVVIISWKPIPGLEGSYVIFRLKEEITVANYATSERIAEVLPPETAYADTPSESGSWFYAILVKEQGKGLRPVFLPYRNKTMTAVAYEAVPGASSVAQSQESTSNQDQVQSENTEAPSSSSETSTQDNTRQTTSAPVSSSQEAVVSHSIETFNIAAKREGESVLVSFDAPAETESVALYRSTSPFSNMQSLVNAQLIKILDATSVSYRDFPIAGVPYYYAVLDVADVKTGTYNFVPGETITQNTVSIPLPEQAAADADQEYQYFRPRPLPFLNLTSRISSGESISSASQMVLPEKQLLETRTEEMVKRLIRPFSTDQKETPSPQILPADATDAFEGNRYALKNILDGSFADEQWESAGKELETLLTMNLDPRLEARVMFYIGQTKYFIGNYRESFLSFLMARDGYYDDVNPWIDRLFAKLN